MIEYWSNWNYIWFLFFKYKFIKMSPSLKISIIFTSLMGAFISHVPENFYIYTTMYTPYPMKLRLKVPYIYRIIGDLLLHQYPLYYMLTQPHEITNSCGGKLFIYGSLWLLINKVRDIDLDSIYSYKIQRIMIPCFMLWSSFGIKHHILNKM